MSDELIDGTRLRREHEERARELAAHPERAKIPAEGLAMPYDEARAWRAGTKNATFYTEMIRARLGDREIERDRQMNVRVNSVDLYMQELPPGSRSGKHRHMADEVLYALEGSGYDLHWDVDLELGVRYDDVEQIEPAPEWRGRTGL